MDRFGVLRALRATGKAETSTCLVMMLTTARGGRRQSAGWRRGADDYVTKPFSPIVLARACRALLKREGRAPMPVEQLGSLSVNGLRREVLVDAQST